LVHPVLSITSARAPAVPPRSADPRRNREDSHAQLRVRTLYRNHAKQKSRSFGLPNILTLSSSTSTNVELPQTILDHAPQRVDVGNGSAVQTGSNTIACRSPGPRGVGVAAAAAVTLNPIAVQREIEARRPAATAGDQRADLGRDAATELVRKQDKRREIS
jgi:hypothetical protein